MRSEKCVVTWNCHCVNTKEYACTTRGPLQTTLTVDATASATRIIVDQSVITWYTPIVISS